MEDWYKYEKHLSPVLRMALEENEELDDFGRIMGA